MKLHHCAYIITPGSSQTMQEFCEFLGAKLAWEGEDLGREIVMQFPTFKIQLSEKNSTPEQKELKKETHIAFSSDNP